MRDVRFSCAGACADAGASDSQSLDAMLELLSIAGDRSLPAAMLQLVPPAVRSPILLLCLGCNWSPLPRVATRKPPGAQGCCCCPQAGRVPWEPSRARWGLQPGHAMAPIACARHPLSTPRPHLVHTSVCPPAQWQTIPTLPPAVRALHQFNSSVMEPWDGPANVAFTDGTVVGCVLDRNGLRPCR